MADKNSYIDKKSKKVMFGLWIKDTRKKLCLGHNIKSKLAYVHLPFTERNLFMEVQTFFC